MNKLMTTSQKGMACRLAFMALLISMSSSGCRTPVKVISADQTLLRVNQGTTLTAPVDGWFMTDALYQRYRRAVADKILETQQTQ
ncbi:hypothetical protein [Pedosphaera parvula]|uniref:Lipoprotein n=1 Tax=Pedosphaera parvula (strain Ellin514) TaxID=320771 RepID=B9XDD6_PEDPL|nr:hypothetical protein [Pedosphaera parvula]EEF62082.1 hypothetical protein Cflav_PD6357 [Pedosphaera parvula Ellin514]